MPAPSTSLPLSGHQAHRARPGLGTFVEIHATAPSAAMLERAIAAGFRAIARVHRCMSPRESGSDVSRINRARAGSVVRVDPWTWQVLAVAGRWSAQSGGAFDITALRTAATRAGWRDLELLDGHRVRLRRRRPIDLGGIAKGFAVDRAVAALRAAGAVGGVVNAGGDLRAFGATPQAVFIRLTAMPAGLVAGPTLQAEAFATSSNALDPRGAGRLRRPDGRRLWIGRGSVSVRSGTCVAADALCKIVAAVGPHQAAPLLARHRATAFVIRAGAPRRSEEVRHAA